MFPDLSHALLRDPEAGEIDLVAAFSADATGFVPAFSAADDAALLTYTSGSTGKPNCTLHWHRILAAHTPKRIAR